MIGILGAQQGQFGRATLFSNADPIADHAHPHLHLLFKVEGNDRGLCVDGEQALLRNDNALLIGPWHRHADLREYCDSSVILAFYLPIDDVKARAGRIPGPLPGNALFVRTAKAQQLIDEVVGLLGGSESARPRERFSEAIGELVEESLLICAQATAALCRTSDYRIRKAMKHLDGKPHLHHDFRQIARQVGLSRSRFFEQFKRSVGVAPMMYVDGLVVERAIAMLVDSDCRIDEISTVLGFAAQSSFSRFFKERVGFSPTELRHAALSRRPTVS